MNTQEKLDQLAEFESQRDSLNAQRDELLAQILPADIKQKMDDINAEFNAKAHAVNENINTLSDEIRSEVLASGETIKGKYVMAIWNKGRTSWDSNKLDGMASIIPQINEARKTGEPSVSFKHV